MKKKLKPTSKIYLQNEKNIFSTFELILSKRHPRNYCPELSSIVWSKLMSHINEPSLISCLFRKHLNQLSFQRTANHRNHRH